MNNDLILGLQQKVSELEERINGINQMITRLKIDRQSVIERNEKIRPGIGVKVSYDMNGLITGSDKLSEADIPHLSIDKIDGLNEILESKAGVGEINRLNGLIRENGKLHSVADTGCKVNIDANGHVVSMADLLVDDIPDLPMSKINGLLDALYNKPVDDFRVRDGKACKITYDSKGRVIKGEALSMDDLPSELITELNQIMAELSRKASNDKIQSIQKSLNAKNSGSNAEPGIYTKIRIDSSGAVFNGGPLNKSDLPDLKISDIDGLQTSLNEKADASEISRLNESISNILSAVSKVSQFNGIKNEISNKADRTELDSVKKDIKELKTSVDRILKSMPSDKLTNEVANLRKTLNDYVSNQK